MKRAALLLLLLAATHQRLPAQAAENGADSPTAAVQQFLAAARKNDLEALAAVWGTNKGPASKTMSTKERERRELIMIRCLPHQQATLGTPAPSEAGRLRIPVELTLLNLKASPVFTVVRGPKRRWYVENLEMDQLRDGGFCGAAPPSPAPPPGTR